MEARGQIPPDLPHANPTESYWQTPPHPLSMHRSTPTLPQKTDYLIIGSGITGTSIAHHLLSRLPTPDSTPDPNHPPITLLEARTLSSGATGRNGGHTKAASYRSFLHHEGQYGTEEAIKIARLEYAVIQSTHALARDLAIPCDSHPCQTVDIIYSATHLAQGKKAIARMREVLGEEDPVAKYEVFDAEEAREKFLVPGALGAFRYEAGSVSAYAFTAGLMERCLERSGGALNLQTETPVSDIVPATGDEGGWVVKTDRGSVLAKQVIVATNGYTARLLPQMQGLVVPLRGQITAQRPGLGLRSLQETYSFIYDDGYEYMITRPSSAKDEGLIVIGGGLGTLPGDGVMEFGNTSDEAMNSELSDYLTECTKRYYGKNWGDDDPKGRVSKEWSGIMGTSADGLPYVGPINDMKGVHICVSFNGHGMVMALKCAEAVVDMVIDGKAKDWFPSALIMEEERLSRQFQGRRNMKARPPGEAMFQKTQ